MIDFNDLHKRSMTYTVVTPEGSQVAVQGYTWSLLSNDKVAFPPVEFTNMNRFKEYEDYMTTHRGAPKSEMKTDFDKFMVVFIRFRDRLLEIMAESCQMAR